MDLGVGRRLSYDFARKLLILTGLVVLSATAVVLFIRRVEGTEIAAAVLFVPIYLAVVMGKVRGGVIVAVLASIVYAVLRLRGVDTLSTGEQLQLVVSRAIAYFVFGLAGGLAVRQLEAALVKLDHHDLIDGDTGLFNARFMVQEIDLELARGTRYDSAFAVVVLDAPVAPLQSLPRVRRAEALRAIGSTVGDAIRLIDRAAIAQDRDSFRIGVVMPETALAGALVVSERLVADLTSAMASRDAPLGDVLTARILAFPDDHESISEIRDQFLTLDRREHPRLRETT